LQKFYLLIQVGGIIGGIPDHFAGGVLPPVLRAHWLSEASKVLPTFQRFQQSLAQGEIPLI